MIEFNEQVNRTLSIIKELSEGKILNLYDGYRIAMTEDMFIGYLIKTKDMEDSVDLTCPLDFKNLNSLLNEYDIGFTIPDITIIEDITLVDVEDIIDD